MKVLLLTDVKLGWRGEMIEVSAGYARNYLLPKHLAIEASSVPPALAKQLDKDREKHADQIQRERKRLQELADRMAQPVEVVLARAANQQGTLFGSVTSNDIAANLAEQGFDVAPDTVRLPDNAAAIKKLGTHPVTIKLTNDLTADVNVVVVPKTQDEGGKSDEGRTEVE